MLVRYWNFSSITLDTFALFHSGLSDGFCSGWLIWQIFLSICTSIITESVLIMRVYAMYGRNKKLLVFLSVVCCLALASALTYFFYRRFTTPASLAIGPAMALDERLRTGCVPFNNLTTYRGSIYNFYWLPMICFETLLSLLVIYKGYESYRGRPGQWKEMSMVEWFIADSVLYFVVVLSVYLVIFFVWTYGDSRLEQLPVPYTLAFSSVMVQRLFLNVNRQFLVTAFHPDSDSIETGTDAVFAVVDPETQLTGTTLMSPNETVVGTDEIVEIPRSADECTMRERTQC